MTGMAAFLVYTFQVQSACMILKVFVSIVKMFASSQLKEALCNKNDIVKINKFFRPP